MLKPKRFAEDLIKEGIELSNLSLETLEEGYHRFSSRQLTPKDKHEVPLRLLASIKDPNVKKAAENFFEAGLLYRISSQWENALKAFHWSRRLFEQMTEEEFREKEIRALHTSAELYMTLSELTPYIDRRKSKYHTPEPPSFS